MSVKPVALFVALHLWDRAGGRLEPGDSLTHGGFFPDTSWLSSHVSSSLLKMTSGRLPSAMALSSLGPAEAGQAASSGSIVQLGHQAGPQARGGTCHQVPAIHRWASGKPGPRIPSPLCACSRSKLCLAEQPPFPSPPGFCRYPYPRGSPCPWPQLCCSSCGKTWRDG